MTPIFAFTVSLVPSEQIMAQDLRIICFKNSALIEVSNISSLRSEIIVAVGWSNDLFRQSRENWLWRNSILISKILRIRFIKYLKLFARVIILCLRNRLLNCILVVNLILCGLRHVIMLFNLKLQPKDRSATSSHQTRSPVTITVETEQKSFLAAVPAQLFQLASSLCFRWTKMWRTVNPTRRLRILLGRQINGRSSGGIFPQMQGNWPSRSSQPGIRTSPIPSNLASIAILFVSQ